MGQPTSFSMMNSNYPPDISPNDPNAPWNQKDYLPFEACDQGVCRSCKEEAMVNDNDQCEQCWYLDQDRE